MSFDLSSWLWWKKIHTQVRLSGRPMQHHRVVNPYHAVGIASGQECCKKAAQLKGRRFLAAAAPKIPLRDCELASCHCRYVHYDDRRAGADRRLSKHDPRSQAMPERRQNCGRRATD